MGKSTAAGNKFWFKKDGKKKKYIIEKIGIYHQQISDAFWLAGRNQTEAVGVDAG